MDNKDLKNLTDGELIDELLKRFADVIYSDSITKEEGRKVLNDLAAIDNIQPYLKSFMKSYIMRYFHAPAESQQIVKGMYISLALFQKLIEEADTKGVREINFTSPRHA